MDNNNFFSFPRIMMVMKREVMENWKTNLYRLIGLYAAFLFTFLIRMYSMSSDTMCLSNPDWALDNFSQISLGIFLFIIGIVSLVYAANIMENMTTKEKRISFLMLPATMIEKFVARFLYVTVGLFIAVLATVSLAEITRLLLLPLFNVPETLHQSVLPKMFFMFTNLIYVSGKDEFIGNAEWGSFNLGLVSICYWAFLIWYHSLYILGGNFWYKKPFFKTLGTLLLVMIGLSIIMTNIISWAGVSNMHSFGQWVGETFNWMTGTIFFAIGIIFFTVFTFFNWWLSYRLFTRSQVIKPKFRLL